MSSVVGTAHIPAQRTTVEQVEQTGETTAFNLAALLSPVPAPGKANDPARRFPTRTYGRHTVSVEKEWPTTDLAPGFAINTGNLSDEDMVRVGWRPLAAMLAASDRPPACLPALRAALDGVASRPVTVRQALNVAAHLRNTKWEPLRRLEMALAAATCPDWCDDECAPGEDEPHHVKVVARVVDRFRCAVEVRVERHDTGGVPGVPAVVVDSVDEVMFGPEQVAELVAALGYASALVSSLRSGGAR